MTDSVISSNLTSSAIKMFISKTILYFSLYNIILRKKDSLNFVFGSIIYTVISFEQKSVLLIKLSEYHIRVRAHIL